MTRQGMHLTNEEKIDFLMDRCLELQDEKIGIFRGMCRRGEGNYNQNKRKMRAAILEKRTWYNWFKLWRAEECRKRNL